MAKIGTAHIEIKPVLSEDALAAITSLIEEAVRSGVVRGMASAEKNYVFNYTGPVVYTDDRSTP